MMRLLENTILDIWAKARKGWSLNYPRRKRRGYNSAAKLQRSYNSAAKLCMFYSI